MSLQSDLNQLWRMWLKQSPDFKDRNRKLATTEECAVSEYNASDANPGSPSNIIPSGRGSVRVSNEAVAVHDLPSIQEGRLTVTPTLAHIIVAKLRYSGQRPAYAHHVALLSDAMLRGKWSAGGQIAFGRLPDGSLHLVNGQHRMLAVMDSGLTQEFQVLVVDVPTERALGDLYYRFDVAARARSSSEILNATGLAAEHGVSKAMAKSVFEAVALLGNQLRRPDYRAEPVRSRSYDVRFETAETWWPIAVEYEGLIEPAKGVVRNRLRMQGVTAVALATLRYQHDKAVPFWTGIAEDDGLRAGDPRHALSRTLLGRDFGAGRFESKVILPANAWNAWYTGREITGLKVLAGSTPKLLGTPYTGKKGKSDAAE